MRDPVVHSKPAVVWMHRITWYQRLPEHSWYQALSSSKDPSVIVWLIKHEETIYLWVNGSSISVDLVNFSSTIALPPQEKNKRKKNTNSRAAICTSFCQFLIARLGRTFYIKHMALKKCISDLAFSINFAICARYKGLYRTSIAYVQYREDVIY